MRYELNVGCGTKSIVNKLMNDDKNMFPNTKMYDQRKK